MAESKERRAAGESQNELAEERQRRRGALRSSPDPGGRGPAAGRQDSDWQRGDAVPARVRSRFTAVGRVFYFPDGAKAFEDHGKRLTTPSNNAEVTASLVAIAEARGWTHIRVSGSERFRQEAWRQATKAGIAVSGYSPSEVEKAQLTKRTSATRAQEDTSDESHSAATGWRTKRGAAVDEPESSRRAAALVLREAALLAEKHIPNTEYREAFLKAVRDKLATRLAENRGIPTPKTRVRNSRARDVDPPELAL